MNAAVANAIEALLDYSSSQLILSNLQHQIETAPLHTPSLFAADKRINQLVDARKGEQTNLAAARVAYEAATAVLNDAELKEAIDAARFERAGKVSAERQAERRAHQRALMVSWH